MLFIGSFAVWAALAWFVSFSFYHARSAHTVVSKYSEEFSVTLTFDVCNIKVIVYSNHLRSEIYIYTRYLSLLCRFDQIAIQRTVTQTILKKRI